MVLRAAPAARGACLASAPGAWRARVCIAFIIMVVSCAVLVVLRFGLPLCKLLWNCFKILLENNPGERAPRAELCSSVEKRLRF